MLLRFEMTAAQKWAMSSDVEIAAKFHTFWSPVKIRGGVGEVTAYARDNADWLRNLMRSGLKNLFFFTSSTQMVQATLRLPKREINILQMRLRSWHLPLPLVILGPVNCALIHSTPAVSLLYWLQLINTQLWQLFLGTMSACWCPHVDNSHHAHTVYVRCCWRIHKQEGLLSQRGQRVGRT